MGDLSLRLSRHEFACRCGNCKRTPVDTSLIPALEGAANYFLILPREDDRKVVRVKIHINSGYRCRVHDTYIKKEAAEKEGRKYIDKKSNSTHLYGMAADHTMEYVFSTGKKRKISDDAIADYYEKKYANRYGIGRYKGRTHLDVRDDGPARWDNR